MCVCDLNFFGPLPSSELMKSSESSSAFSVYDMVIISGVTILQSYRVTWYNVIPYTIQRSLFQYSKLVTYDVFYLIKWFRFSSDATCGGVHVFFRSSLLLFNASEPAVTSLQLMLSSRTQEHLASAVEII